MASPWWQRRMCAIDLETTGTDPRTCRIVTAAVVLVGGSGETVSRTWLIDPGVEIPDEAAAVHGITTERARTEGRPASTAIPEISEQLIGVCMSGYPVVVFNSKFDLTVIHHEQVRHGLFPIGDEPAGLRVVDPLVVDRWLDRYRKGSRKLEAMCQHYGVQLDGAHDAAHDAIAAARLAWVLAARGRVMLSFLPTEVEQKTAEWEHVRNDLDALHAAQVRWAAEQAQGLEEHFARQGKPERVERAWPVLA